MLYAVMSCLVVKILVSILRLNNNKTFEENTLSRGLVHEMSLYQTTATDIRIQVHSISNRSRSEYFRALKIQMSECK